MAHANRAAIELFGFGNGLIGRSVDDLVPLGARADHAAMRAQYQSAPATRPMALGAGLRAARADGSTLPVEIALSPLTTDEGQFTVATIRDVSEWLSVRIGHRRDQARVALLEERERIARDLHDMVIQRIFATGMSLQAALVLVDSDGARERVTGAIDELDDTIRDIRNTIFELHLQHRSPVSVRLADIIAERSEQWQVHSSIAGDIDQVEPDLADDMVAVMTEALSNIGRHAHAGRVDITVGFDSGSLCIRVDDDGTGLPAERRDGRGMVNLRERADRRGGRCIWVAQDNGGTSMRWSVPMLPPTGG